MKITQKITSLLLISAIIVSAFSFSAVGAATVKGSEVAAYARQFEGCAYQYACKGPDKFDCSGLVYYVLKNFGITFGDGTSAYNTPEKAKTYGTVIESMSDAKPGDIVAWGSHAAIYLGEGKCISAMNAKKGVIITVVDEFVDRLGVKNPYHFFIRPYEYIEETAEDVEDNTTEAPETPENGGENNTEIPGAADDGTEESTPSDNTVSLFELIILVILRIAELLVSQFATVTNIFRV